MFLFERLSPTPPRDGITSVSNLLSKSKDFGDIVNELSRISESCSYITFLIIRDSKNISLLSSDLHGSPSVCDLHGVVVTPIHCYPVYKLTYSGLGGYAEVSMGSVTTGNNPPVFYIYICFSWDDGKIYCKSFSDNESANGEFMRVINLQIIEIEYITNEGYCPLR